MNLTVIGSGTTVPHPERSSSGYWVENQSGASLMLDFSASAVHRIAEEKLDWTNLDAIWISHFHLDHIGGLAPFLFGTKYAPAMQNRTKPLRIFSPKGLKKILERYDAADDFGFLEQPFPLEFKEVEPLEKFEILEGTEAVSYDTPHTDESLAIRLTDAADGKSVVYSADTGFAKALGSFAKNADLFVLECSFVENSPVETHLTLAQAMYLARYSEAKKIVLTHLYPEWDEFDFDEKVRQFSPSNEIIKAFDGLKIEV